MTLFRKLGVTPTNFLKCNDGVVDKGLYADLYAVIGDRFKREIRLGAGKPWKQYDINSVGDSLGAWTTATSLPGALFSSQSVVIKNRVYLLGKWYYSHCTRPYQEEVLWIGLQH